MSESSRSLPSARPFYDEVASVRVDTDGKTPEEVADEVLRLLPPAP